MIRLIHKYNRSIAIVFLFVCFCFALSGVGVDVLHDRSAARRPAVEVNETSISQAEFARAERNTEERYRKMFGPNFEQYAQMLGINVTQQTIDQAIDMALLNQKASEFGFAADDETVRRFILEKIFSEMPYDEARFRGLLQSSGITFREFSKEVKDEYSRETLANLLRDTAYVSNRDVESQMIRQETSYGLTAAVINKSDVLASAPAPTEEQLKAFYDQNAAQFENPPQVSYSYIEIAPSSFEKDVQVSQQDIEVYYTENSGNFTEPEQVKVREIKILYPKNSDEKAKEATRSKAKQALDEAKAAKAFQDVVSKYSEDSALKVKGGDRGWVSRGSESPAYEKIVFAAEPGVVAELIETQEGFRIVKVEEKKASALKPLDQVRAQIEAEIRKAEAPAYASSKAQELLKGARRDGKSLPEIAGVSGFTVKDSSGLVSSAKDSPSNLAGLTAKVLAMPSGDRAVVSLVEVGDTSALVLVKEYKDASLAPFAEVKGKITEYVKSQEALKLAEKKAQEVLAAAQAAPQNFEVEAKKLGAKFVGPVQISRAEPSSPALPELSPQMQSAVFATSKTPSVLPRVFPNPEGFVVAAVVNITQPDLSKKRPEEELSRYKAEAREQAARSAVESELIFLKTSATIDVDPALQNRR